MLCEIALLDDDGVTAEVANWQDNGSWKYVIDSPYDEMSKSQNSFEVWFKEQALEIHGIDFNQPMPGPISEDINEWSVE